MSRSLVAQDSILVPGILYFIFQLRKLGYKRILIRCDIVELNRMSGIERHTKQFRAAQRQMEGNRLTVRGTDVGLPMPCNSLVQKVADGG